MSRSPELDRARRYAELVHDGDVDALQDFFTDDVRWHVAGANPRSGDHRGRPGLLAYLAATRGGLRREPERVIASAGHAAVFTRISGEREGTAVDAVIAEVLESGPDGRWTEYWSAADDQEAVDRLWAEGSQLRR